MHWKPRQFKCFRIFCIGLKIKKNEPCYDSKDFSKILQEEQDWEEPLVKKQKAIGMWLLVCIFQ